VTCLWLMPFYATANEDDGYDVTDHVAIDERLGTLPEFVELLRQAKQRGIRVLVDLVVNHTSRHHPWFQAARRDASSKYRGYYVWSEHRPRHVESGVVFTGEQQAVWSFDDEADAWYFHRFYRFEPDLATEQADVRGEIRRIVEFWLELGVAGFRIDAIPFVISRKHQGGGAPDYEYLSELRGTASWRSGESVLLAEANVAYEDAGHYFGRGDRMHMMFDFDLNQRLFLALAEQRAAPIAEALTRRPSIPGVCEWATFLRNHDELDLGRLSEDERQRVYDAFAPERNMHVFNRGIRRRLGSMLRGDAARMKLAYSLLFSLPGTPVIFYGEEIGMGEDLSRPGRYAVRTPMQWAPVPGGDFSDAPRSTFVRAPIEDGAFSIARVNVVDEWRDPESLLNTVARAAAVRRQTPELCRGDCSTVKTRHDDVLVLERRLGDRVTVVAHNLAPARRRLSIERPMACPVALFGNAGSELSNSVQRLDLPPYGFLWLRGYCRHREQAERPRAEQESIS